MWYCVACGHINPDEARTCTRCQASLGPVCLACGLQVLPGDRFCSHCGAELSQRLSSSDAVASKDRLLGGPGLHARLLVEQVGAASPTMVGERREVTVLALDIVGLAPTTQVLDSEDIYLLTDEVMDLLAEVVYRYEGTIYKYMGNGFMALFGVPLSHENDPERAVRAGLEMQQAFVPLRERIRRERALELRVCIGIATGQVIAGRIDRESRLEYIVTGDTLSKVELLRSSAEPDSVAVGFEAYQRTQPLFEYQPLPPIRTPTTSQAIRAFRPLRLRARPGQVRGLPGLQVSMIGREDGLARLQDMLATCVRHGRTQVALVTGEAGVGKSRLVAEFLSSVIATEAAVYQGECLTYARSKPLWLFATLLRQMIHVAENDPIDVQRSTLQTYLKQLDLLAQDVLPYLSNLLGLGQEDPLSQVRFGQLDSTMLQKLTHAAVRRVLMAEACQAPTILVFEDLHWIDPASRDLLQHLILTVDEVPLALILVSRDVARQSIVYPLIAAAEQVPERMTDIPLTPLSEDEGRLLVGQLLPRITESALAIKERIAQRAEGNPFYAEEIVRMLIDQGGLVCEDDVYRVTPLADGLLSDVPGTLGGLIQARLDRLPHTLRRILREAAVIGTVFPIELLAALDGAGPQVMVARLLELEARQFLVSRPSGLDQTMAFRHALIQEVVYHGMLKRGRQELHGLVARAIEQSAFWLPEEQSELLAYHYVESSDPVKALPHLIAAGENAARRCANETAIQHYRRALALLDERPAEHGDLRLKVLMGLGQALKFVGEYSEASEILMRSLKLLLEQSATAQSLTLMPQWVHSLRELADIQLRESAPGEAVAYLQAGLDLLGDAGAEAYSHPWRLLMDRLAWVRFRQGQLDEALSLASSAALGLDLEGAEDPITLASLYNTMGGIRWQQGNLSEAITYVGRSLELYERAGYAWGTANAFSNLGVLHYRLGNWPEALDNWQRALQLRQTIGDIQHQAITLNNLCFLRISLGAHEQAKRDAEEALALGKRLGDNWIIAPSLVNLSQLALAQSDPQTAAIHAEAALELSQAIGSNEIQVQARSILALTQAETENVETALESAERALALARQGGFQDLEGDCLLALGIVRARLGQWLEAETLFHESIEVCLQQQDPYRHGLALLEMGRMYQSLARTGDLAGAEWRAKAVQALNGAIERFERLGAARDLKLAQAALQESQASMAMEVPVRVPEGEWHRAAILWLTVSAPPETDEEEVFEAIVQLMPALTAIARELQGQVIQRHDGLTVVFGAPVAYEDDAERAILAAQQMQAYVCSMPGAQQAPVLLSCRVAVSYGDVVAGRTGSRFHTQFMVKGEAVDLAQRIAESAPPGRVWVAEPAYAVTRRLFAYQSAPPSVAALVGGLAFQELVGLREQPAPARGLPGTEGRFIGREEDLRTMTKLAARLSEGLGGLIWIEGEPGIGKSRLMREFIARVANTEILVWKGTCSPQKMNHAFSLISDLLTQLLNLQPTDASEQIRAKIQEAIQTWPADTQAVRPYLEILLGGQTDSPISQRLASLPPEQLRQQIFVAMRRLLKGVASEHPLIMALDDMHWIDPVSVELLLFLFTMVASVPILFVCAQRRQGADAPNDRLIKAQSLIPSQTARLQLERLSWVESEMLLDALLPQAELAVGLRQSILERCEGNPYFIEEYVRMLSEQGYLQPQPGRLQAEAPVSQPLPLPSSLETLIRSRIDALPQELKQVIQYAAVIGAPFQSRLLQSLPGLSNVNEALARLESRLLLRRGDEADQWRFHHSLIETVVYSSLLKARRKALHLEVAQTLEKGWAGTEAEHAEELAYHFTRADEGAKALSYLILAGERAAARFANEEALALLQQAAELEKAQPETPPDLSWRLAASLGDVHRGMGQYANSKAALTAGLALLETAGPVDTLRAGLYRRLGETCHKQGDLQGAHEHFTRALALLGSPTDHATQAEAARLLTGLAWTYFLQGQFDASRDAAEASVAHAQAAGALSELASAENLVGGIHYRRSEWSEALQHTTRAMVLREQMGYTWGVASTLNNLGILAVQAGQWTKARSFFERSLTLRQEIGDMEGCAISHNNLGMLARDQGDLDLAESNFKDSLSVSGLFEMHFHITNSYMGLAEVYARKGNLEAAREAIAASLQRAESLGARDLMGEIYLTQAEILLAGSTWEEAGQTAERSISLAVETGNRSLEAAAWRVVSEVELQQGKCAAASQALDRARQALTNVTDELENGRIAAQAGRIALHEGQFDQAEKELRTAKEVFMRLGAQRDMGTVEEALKRLPKPDVRELLTRATG